jgi:UPF0755 protein
VGSATAQNGDEFLRRAALIIVAVVIASIAYAGLWFSERLEAKLHAPMATVASEEVLEVRRGTSLRKLLVELAERGLVDDADEAYLALRYHRWRGRSLPMPKAGEFIIQTDMSLLELLKHLASGKVKTYRVTIPEGLRVGEILNRLGASELLDLKTLSALIADAGFADTLELPLLPRRVVGHPNAERFEGWLFPTTYTFTRATSEKALLRQMVEQTRRVLEDPALMAKAKALGWSPGQVLSMASVIEKETAKASERPIISGVFHNRLRLGMKLETDPTIIYGIVGYDGNIRRRDIRKPHPWNCYVHHGLPATPIASPGRAAIAAAVAPAKTDALFFVSRNDGSHVFCPHLRCHQAAVEKWQRRFFRKKNRR